MANKRKKKIPAAFTFIELSVTIIVISILTFVILGGSKSLFSSSSLTRARALTTNAPVTKINGLVAWYETSLPESFKSGENVDNFQITEWHDLNPQSIVLEKNKLTKTAGSDVIYVKNGINGVPAVKFSSTGKIALSAFAQGSTKQNSVFVVLSLTSYATGYQLIFDAGPSSSECSLSFHNNGLEIFSGATGHTPKTITTNTPYLVGSYFNGASSKIFLNDVTGNTVNGGTTTVLAGLTVGGYHNTSYPSLSGMISEVIVYNRLLNINERKAVMGYLAKKYSISVTGLN